MVPQHTIRDVKVQDEFYKRALQSLAVQNLKEAVSHFMTEKFFREAAIEEIKRIIAKEADMHCTRKNESILRLQSRKSLEELSIEKLSAEMQVSAAKCFYTRKILLFSKI